MAVSFGLPASIASRLSMFVRVLYLLAGFFLLSGSPQAQFGTAVPETVVTWTASARPPSSAPRMTNTFRTGERVYVTLTADIVDGWRVYAIASPAGRPLVIELDPLPTGVTRYGSPGETDTKVAHDRGLDADYSYHDGTARVWQGLQVDEQADEGEHDVTGRVLYAACNDEMCLPVKTVPFRARFVVSN